MSSQGKFILAALAAAFMLAAVTSAASASRLSVNERGFEFIWRSLYFGNPSGTFFSRCPITMLGSFHERTIVKRERALIGVIRHVDVGSASCTASGVTVLRETLPWHVVYNGFGGTLPTIFELRLSLVGLSVRIQNSVGCLLRTEAGRPLQVVLNLSGGRVTSVSASEASSIPLRPSPDAICEFIEGIITGVEEKVTTLTGAALVIRLI